MLSVGIRSGKGFDSDTINQFVKHGKDYFEYDVLILGTNPGGMACARTTSKNDKKTALVSWRIPTPAEEEGHEEDLCQMSEALNMNDNSIRDRTYEALEMEDKTEIMDCISNMNCHHKISQVGIRSNAIQKSQKWFRKVRRSKIDLKNAITNMAAEGRRYMHEIALVQDQRNKYSRMSWGKLMENVLDHIIHKNWTILTDFIKDKVAIYKGYPILLDDHTVKIIEGCGEKIITAEKIVSALEVRNIFPSDVSGAREFGINGDDFFRLACSPGKTLVVGANALGMECAGILATFGFPVVIVYRSEIIKECDRAIANMIVEDLSRKGVTFMHKTRLISIEKNAASDKLKATAINSMNVTFEEDFDTVLFTTKDKITANSKSMEIRREIEEIIGKSYPAEKECMFRDLHVITDQPENRTATEIFGIIMGHKLFYERDPKMDIKIPLYPNILLTPLEYAYIGATEMSAISRLGVDCVSVYDGYFEVKKVLPTENAEVLCYAKVIEVRERNLIIGLHFVGSKAIQIMNSILEPPKVKIFPSDLPDAIRKLMVSS